MISSNLVAILVALEWLLNSTFENLSKAFRKSCHINFYDIVLCIQALIS